MKRTLARETERSQPIPIGMSGHLLCQMVRKVDMKNAAEPQGRTGAILVALFIKRLEPGGVNSLGHLVVH